jgi:hypothetical protein
LGRITYNIGMEFTKKHLFIDLEETLIDNWDAANLGPRNKVLHLLEKHFDHTLSTSRLDATIWSFAVWDEKDVKDFDQRMCKWLEDHFNLSFIRIVSCKEMRDAIVKLKGFNMGLDVSEMVQLWGKDRSLEDWVKFHLDEFADSEIVLLDDLVMNRSVHFHDANVKITFAKV